NAGNAEEAIGQSSEESLCSLRCFAAVEKTCAAEQPEEGFLASHGREFPRMRNASQPKTTAGLARGASEYHDHRGSHRSLSLRGTSGERAGERGTFHRIGAANWNPLSLTLSPLLRRGERESTSDMVVSSAPHVARDCLRLILLRIGAIDTRDP